MDLLQQIYAVKCQKKGDIHEHLPTLRKYAQECERILELGVRGVVSSYAFLTGIVENGKPIKKIFMNDLSPCPISDYLSVATQVGVEVHYEWKNDLDLQLPEPIDLTFIDTWHVYGQLKRELEKFSPLTRKYIIMHDTEVDKIRGETVRCNMNVEQQVKQSGFPRHEILNGLQDAIREFLQAHPEWKVREVFTNNNGLTILERVY